MRNATVPAYAACRAVKAHNMLSTWRFQFEDVIMQQLESFVSPHDAHVGGADLCLPEFAGSQATPLKLAGKPDKFAYPSQALASRDVKSAFHVRDMLSGCLKADAIELQSPNEFLDSLKQAHGDRVRFLFGSRSNRALGESAHDLALDRLVRFEFGDQWVIVGQDDRRFSLPDPSQLSNNSYQDHTDYCVVARVSFRNTQPIFVIAGLGGRATEGGGRYVAGNWKSLHKRFRDSDFAVVLAFPPPIRPEYWQEVAAYTA